MPEYKNVLKLSADREALEFLWRIPITEDDANITIFAYLDEGEVEVRFTCKKNGAAHPELRWMRLPGEGKCLTLGLVLHEIAHVLTHNDIGKDLKPHGPEYVKVLDSLVISEMTYGRYDRKTGSLVVNL